MHLNVWWKEEARFVNFDMERTNFIGITLI